MTTTNFVSGTVIDAAWLNDVDEAVYNGLPATQSFYTPAGTGAVATTVQAKLRESVSVLDFGASTGASTAVNDAAFQAACDSGAKYIYIPPGRYSKSAAVIPQSNQVIYGAGRSPVMPYAAGTWDLYVSEIYIAASVAFDCTGLTNVTIRGLGIKASGGGISTYGAAANYVVGSIGVVITDTQVVRMEDISFHGLEYGVAASHAVDGAYADMFSLDGFSASDCKVLVRIGNGSTSGYVAADGRVANNDIALHCNTYVEAYFTDGLRVENCRFFQAYTNSIYLEECPYVTLSSVTCFETLGNNLYAFNCQYLNGSGLSFSRSGGYTVTTPWTPTIGINLIGCEQVSLQGGVNFSAGPAVSLTSSCNNVNLNLGIDQPFYTNGQTTAGNSGAIAITGSTNVNLNCSLNGDTYIYAVSTDYSSAMKTFGTVNSDKYAGALRAWNVIKNGYSFTKKIDTNTAVNASSSFVADYVQVPVPNGTSLVSRSMHMTFPDITLRIAADFWTGGLVVDADGGNTSYEKKTIYTNSTGSDVLYQVPISVYNPTAGVLTVLAGTLVHTSFAIE